MTTARQMNQQVMREADDRLRRTQILESKWGKWLQGLGQRDREDTRIRRGLAQCYENEAIWLRDFQMTEATTTANVGYYAKFVFPLLRWVWPNLIAHETVSVQPMNSAQGTVFHLNYVLGTTKGQTIAGAVAPRDFDANYTSEFVEKEIIALGDGAAYSGGGAFLNATLVFKPVYKPDAIRNFEVIIQDQNASGVAVQTAEAAADGTFSGDSASGTLNFSNGAITGFKFNAIPATGNRIVCSYWYNGELSSMMPEGYLDIAKAQIQARTRRLKNVYSLEAAMDLRNEHGIEAETELLGLGAQEMALEIDREIIGECFKASGGIRDVFNRTPPGGISELDHLRSLLTPISRVSNTILKKTLRAQGNWIITSPDVHSLLEQLTTHGDYRPIWNNVGDETTSPAAPPRPQNRHGQFPIYKAGTLLNKWVVYVDPFFQYDHLMVGLKGSSYLDAGFVYAPYVPIQVTHPFLDPGNLSYRSAMFARYATRLLRSDYYGQVRIFGLTEL